MLGLSRRLLLPCTIRSLKRPLSGISRSILAVSKPVQEALAAGKPVVALESTIISHGMPYPANLTMAQEVEAIIASYGVVPATVAILDGQVKVGLSGCDLETLARTGPKATKCSTRDMPVALALGLVGATTVAGTMTAAAMAGIRVFVTGGIGGVHRGGEVSMDVSADLMELGKTQVAVVCAGVKSILDIDKTLQVLETQGVPVLCLGSDEFPAFFTPHSQCKAPVRCDDVSDVAKVLLMQDQLTTTAQGGCGGCGLLLAVPNPHPADAANTTQAIDEALREAESLGIKGKDVTPFLLKRVNEKSQGESLKANIALVKNNAHKGAQLALAYAQLKQQAAGEEVVVSKEGREGGVVVVGAAVMDTIASPTVLLEGGTSVPGTVTHKSGGVGRNVAEACARCGTPTTLLTAVGNDAAGAALRSQLQSLAPTLALHSTTKATRSASYVAMLDSQGDLLHAVADMKVTEEYVSPSFLNTPHISQALQQCRLLVVDGNVTAPTFQALCGVGVPVLFEPTSVPKSLLPISANCLPHVTITKPNLQELLTMAGGVAEARGESPLWHSDRQGFASYIREELMKGGEGRDRGVREVVHGPVTTLLHEMNTQGVWWEDGCKHVLVSLGTQGLIWAYAHKGSGTIIASHREVAGGRPMDMHDCTGAGDTMVGALCAGLVRGYSMDAALTLSLYAARLAVTVPEAVPRSLTWPYLTTQAQLDTKQKQ